jgi:hypothetical protein
MNKENNLYIANGTYNPHKLQKWVEICKDSPQRETQAKFSFLSFEFFIHYSVNILKMNALDSQRNKNFFSI